MLEFANAEYAVESRQPGDTAILQLSVMGWGQVLWQKDKEAAAPAALLRPRRHVLRGLPTPT